MDTSDQQPPSQAVVEAIATIEGVPPCELGPPEYEPLHAVLDPEALDALFAGRADGTSRPRGSVSFAYCGYAITVDQYGTVTIDGQVDD